MIIEIAQNRQQHPQMMFNTIVNFLFFYFFLILHFDLGIWKWKKSSSMNQTRSNSLSYVFAIIRYKHIS